jgi:phenylpyruvate tautomerase PptA (4-oxalocrotonate tautomerase family)
VPAIIVNSLELTDDQKRVLADTFTRAFSDETKVPMDRIYVFFQGCPLSDAAAGGRLFADHPPQGIVGKFNQRVGS